MCLCVDILSNACVEDITDVARIVACKHWCAATSFFNWVFQTNCSNFFIGAVIVVFCFQFSFANVVSNIQMDFSFAWAHVAIILSNISMLHTEAVQLFFVNWCSNCEFKRLPGTNSWRMLSTRCVAGVGGVGASGADDIRISERERRIGDRERRISSILKMQQLHATNTIQNNKLKWIKAKNKHKRRTKKTKSKQKRRTIFSITNSNSNSRYVSQLEISMTICRLKKIFEFISQQTTHKTQKNFKTIAIRLTLFKFNFFFF